MIPFSADKKKTRGRGNEDTLQSGEADVDVSALMFTLFLLPKPGS